MTVGVDGNIRRCDMVTEDETEETSVSENEAVSEGSANVSEYSLAAPEDDDEDGASSALDYEVETEVKETISVVAVEPEMSKEAEETEAAVEAETEAAETEAAVTEEAETDEDGIAAFDEEITDGVDPESIERVSKFS